MSSLRLAVLVGLASLLAFPVASGQTSAGLRVLPSDVPAYAVPAPDLAAVAAEDQRRSRDGLPPRFAVPHAVRLTPANSGGFQARDLDTVVWRLRVVAPGARNLNFGFRRFVLPAGAELVILTDDERQILGPFTAADNDAHGELWTPVVAGEEAVLQLTLTDRALGRYELELGHIGYGYLDFPSQAAAQAVKSGSCNVDVTCTVGDPWQSEIRSVAVYSMGGSLFCTGVLVNNTASDETPLFLTADHCGVTAGNAASLVVYWNYETAICGATPSGSLSEFQTGAIFRAAHSPSDFTLVELDDTPSPGFGVTYAGWNRSSANPPGAVAIHHPSTDEKRISFENDPTSTTSYLSNSVPGDGSHVRVLDWDLGTTEPGSSGSPLFDLNHRIIGQLHGGFAACGNDQADWYGRVSASWSGGGSAATRLSDWLDPLSTGATTTNTLVTSMVLTPGTSVEHTGPPGGPFTTAAVTYTLHNFTGQSLQYQVSLGSALGVLLDGGTSAITGTLATGATRNVEVSLGPAIDALAAGTYAETVAFADTTNGHTAQRLHRIVIGSGGGCPTLTALAEDPRRDVIRDTLYRFRNELLQASPEGQAAIRAFYAYADEVRGHLEADPLLRQQVRELLRSLEPVFQARLSGQVARLQPAELRSAEQILQTLSRRGSLSLRLTAGWLAHQLRRGAMVQAFGFEVAAESPQQG